jgi:hypothetical protein
LTDVDIGTFGRLAAGARTKKVERDDARIARGEPDEVTGEIGTEARVGERVSHRRRLPPPEGTQPWAGLGSLEGSGGGGAMSLPRDHRTIVMLFES